MNPKTSTLIDAFIHRPSSSLLLIGSEDDGIEEIIDTIILQLLDMDHRYNVVTLAPDEGKGISIEQARDLKKQLSNRFSSDSEIARVVIIYKMDTATREAQNALLKLVEEPLKQTILILQATNIQNLLPTILSRCQMIPVLPITKIQATELATNSKKSENESLKAFLLSGGKAKLYEKMLSSEEIGITEDISTAKTFLQSSTFHRLEMLKQYDKPDALIKLITSIEIVASAALHTSNGTNLKRWTVILNETRYCAKLLTKNTLTKLVYMRLCVAI